MNIFRLCGDLSHAAGIALLVRMAKRGNASGISLKAQELYLIVFLARYMDLFTMFYSLYNSTMKLFFIATTGGIVCMLRCSETARSSYSPAHDSFQHWLYLLLPSLVAALLLTAINYYYEGRFYFMIQDQTMAFIVEVLWAFSIILESVAMIPQLVMFRSDRYVKENRGASRDEILLPVFLLGIYRFLYIINWIYRAHTEPHYRHHYLVYVFGALQVFTYSQFFHMYICELDVLGTRSTPESPTGVDVDEVNEDLSETKAETESLLLEVEEVEAPTVPQEGSSTEENQSQ